MKIAKHLIIFLALSVTSSCALQRIGGHSGAVISIGNGAMIFRAQVKNDNGTYYLETVDGEVLSKSQRARDHGPYGQEIMFSMGKMNQTYTGTCLRIRKPDGSYIIDAYRGSETFRPTNWETTYFSRVKLPKIVKEINTIRYAEKNIHYARNRLVGNSAYDGYESCIKPDMSHPPQNTCANDKEAHQQFFQYCVSTSIDCNKETAILEVLMNKDINIAVDVLANADCNIKASSHYGRNFDGMDYILNYGLSKLSGMTVKQLLKKANSGQSSREIQLLANAVEAFVSYKYCIETNTYACHRRYDHWHKTRMSAYKQCNNSIGTYLDSKRKINNKDERLKRLEAKRLELLINIQRLSRGFGRRSDNTEVCRNE